MVLITTLCFSSSVSSDDSKDSLTGLITDVKCLATCSNPYSDQSPNQSITHRLNNAGDDAVLLEKSGLLGFMVNTTCKFLCTFLINVLYI
jgi:hypothetical protein